MHFFFNLKDIFCS